jgi:hypothetical protein
MGSNLTLHSYHATAFKSIHGFFRICNRICVDILFFFEYNLVFKADCCYFVSRRATPGFALVARRCRACKNPVVLPHPAPLLACARRTKIANPGCRSPPDNPRIGAEHGADFQGAKYMIPVEHNRLLRTLWRGSRILYLYLPEFQFDVYKTSIYNVDNQ